MLIITEKPKVASSFSVALNVPRNNQGYYGNENIEITSCRGHLFELYKPEDYDPKYKIWKQENLPIIPKTYRYKKIDATITQTNLVLELLKKHKDDEIIIATDADREGELIARIVFAQAGLTDTKKCYRFWTSAALTEKNIQLYIKDAKPWNAYNTLAQSGFARQHADWLVGMNLTPYITLLSGGKATFPIGRVQTAILAAVAQRNKEIKEFVAKEYYECQAEFKDKDGNKIKALLVNPETKKTFFEKLEHYINSANTYSKVDKKLVTETKTERKTKAPPRLLNLTELSIIAAQKFNYTATQVERICEKLYDEYECISYPRTPSQAMRESEEDVATYRDKFELIKSDFEISRNCNIELINIKNKHIFNDKECEGHYGLIPFGHLPKDADEKEKNIYETVCKYFFMACMDDCIYDEKTFKIFNGKYEYRTKINTIVKAGWKEIGKTEKEEEEIIQFDEKTIELVKTEIIKKLTTPKKEFTESTLLKFMKNPTGEKETEGRLVGLGTEATRGKIIENLQAHGYIEKIKKDFFATNKGYFVLKQLFKNPYTAKIAGISQTTIWEKKLEKQPDIFEKEIEDYVLNCVSVRIEVEKYEKPPIGICPLCGKKVFESKTNFFCSGYQNEPKCSFTIWKNICSTKIDTADAILLLQNKTTKERKLKTKEGKEFRAKLKIEAKTGKIIFIFNKKKKK